MGYFAFRSAPLAGGPAGGGRRDVLRLPPQPGAAGVAGRVVVHDRRAGARRPQCGRRRGDGRPRPDRGPRRGGQLAWQAASAADVSGRPLAAAHQAELRSDNPRIALWQATAVLREHRGDGHVAVLVGRGVGPVEAHLLKSGSGESDEATLRLHRGFPDDEWAAARGGMIERGWLDADGRLTARGTAEHDAVEAATDAAAEQPWQAIGPAAMARLRDLLDPIATTIRTTGLIPTPTP